jgi:hypothetical protein
LGVHTLQRANFVDIITHLPHLASALENHPPMEEMPADLPADHDAAAEDTGGVDLGWGMVLPELSI